MAVEVGAFEKFINEGVSPKVRLSIDMLDMDQSTVRLALDFVRYISPELLWAEGFSAKPFSSRAADIAACNTFSSDLRAELSMEDRDKTARWALGVLVDYGLVEVVDETDPGLSRPETEYRLKADDDSITSLHEVLEIMQIVAYPETAWVFE